MNYGLEKPKLLFLKSLGLRRLCEKFRADKLEPKADKCIFIGHPKQLGIPPVSDPKAIGIVSRIRSFLEKEFLSNELSGRKIELDKVVEPLLRPESSATQEKCFCDPCLS